MYFSNILEDDVEYKIIETDKLKNNILIHKIKIDENQCNVVKLKENQCAIIFEKGNIHDLVKEEGIYIVKNGESQIDKDDLKEYIIKNNSDKLCILFFNLDIITNNKFYIRKSMKNNFYGNGEFDFKITNPIKLFNKVISVRTYYSREELLEQIRERLSKIMIPVIKEHKEEYIISETEISQKLNIFKEYGVTITYWNTENIKFNKI